MLKQADAQVEAGEDRQAARTFVSAFDAMDLADRVGNTGKFAADRAVTSYLKAWRIESDVSLLTDAETFLLRYLDELERGKLEGCGAVDRVWADDKLAEVRAEMPSEDTPPPGEEVVGPKPAPKNCPSAPSIIGVDRAGVALVTVGASLFVSGAALLTVGLVRTDIGGSQALSIIGGVLMGGGVAFVIPGAVRLATWKRKQGRAQLGRLELDRNHTMVAPWTGRGLAGVSVSGRFGARR